MLLPLNSPNGFAKIYKIVVFPNTIPLPSFCDNLSAKIFNIMKSNINYSKHIEVKYHYLWEKVGSQEVTLVFTPTNSM